MIELEKTYLVKSLPAKYRSAPAKRISDIYLVTNADHPTVRLRRKGNTYTLTKKLPIDLADASRQRETTIPLTEIEYQALAKVEGRRLDKTRYFVPYQGVTVELDVFHDKLAGLVLAEIEFKSIAEKDNCPMPKFCLADVTQEKFLAGGILAGKSYNDIKTKLAQFSYRPPK